MRMRIRFLIMILFAMRRKRNLEVSEESVLRFVVMPWDCVVKLVSNDRYHAFMDIGRIDLILRFGWGRVILKNKWEPFVKTADIRYRTSLKLFQRFTLRTRFLYWDNNHFWMQHTFERKGRTVAIAISKNLATSRKGVVKTSEAIRLLRRDLKPPQHADAVKIINDTEELLRTLQRN